ncbi:hypothetical protein PybrP1_011333 [[Pythium] brassicae (nom. inval.)]|nr:hypothetical protein PybrP1_011333 [[Pythium] brassicae (nom. inval.)]
MTSTWSAGAAGGGSSSAETAFEFPRDLERFVHERVLNEARARQRSSLRPGVTSAGRAVDVLRRERTVKRLARALRVLREDLDVAEPLAREALSYANGLEDALRFLALQFESDELPRSLRALPGAASDDTRASGEGDGELVVAVAAAASLGSAGVEAVGREAVAAPTEVADSWDDLADDSETATESQAADATAAPEESSEPAKTSALSWTQQYLQVIAAREEEEARAAAAFAKLSPDEKRVLELEAQFSAALAAAQQAKADKVSKKKQKALAYELQLLRQRLAERGWSELEFHARASRGAGAGGDDNDAAAAAASTAQAQLEPQTPIDSDPSEREAEREDRDAAVEPPAADDADESDENYGGSLFDDVSASSEAATASAAAPASVDEPVCVRAGTGGADASSTATRRGKGKKKAGRVEPSGAAAAWTGKSPRDHIQDYCKKGRLPQPVYKKVPMRSRTFVYTLVLDFKTHKHEYAVPDEGGAKAGFATIDEAKDTVATHALYALSPDLPLYRVLPPAYRDLWLDWVRARAKEAADAVSLEKEGFDAVVSALLAQIPDEVRANVVAAPPLADETESAPRHAAAAAAAPLSEDESESDDDDDDAGAAAAPASSALLADWAVDDWEADLSDAEAHDTSEPTGDDAPAEDEAAREDPAAQAYSQQLGEQLRRNMRSSAFIALWGRRQDLPIAAFKTRVLAALETHDVVLISGETGCGKSTQVPQFLLEDMLLAKQQGARCQIVCTQPRRLAAISLAERVSQELGEPAMGAGDSLCGFQIRLEARRTAHTRLLFCTTGILLRRLQEPATLATELSHIIVDEVHERDVQNDVLLSLLREFLRGANKRRATPLKVLLMSATLNAASFQAYFGGERVCPMLTVPGRTFPVQELFLEDVLELTEYVIDDASPAYIPYESVQQSAQLKVSGRGGTSVSQRVYWEASSRGRTPAPAAGSGATGDDEGQNAYSERTRKMLACIDASVINYELIVELVEHVVTKSELVRLSDAQPSASILVFLPGLHEISTLLDLLSGHRLFRDEQRFSLLPLHSSLSPQDQQRIFRQARGVRTSVLEEIWIARANATQRMGRAGRTSGGVCFRLFPRAIYRSTMAAQPVPEIQRAPLTSLCLQIKSFGVAASCSAFLGGCLDPPDDASVRDALLELFEIGALERAHETLTTLGRHLARLPVDVKVGKLLLLGALFDVFDPVATSAAVLETRSPFVAPYGHQSEMQAARRRFAVAQSDLLTDVNAYEAWRAQFPPGSSNSNGGSSRAEREFCRQHFLSHRALLEITKLKQQFHGLVAQAGYLPRGRPPAPGPLTRATLAMAAAVLYAGLAPNLVRVERAPRDDAAGRKRPLLRDQDHTVVAVHPSSVNYQSGQPVAALASAFLTYAVKLHTSQIYLPTSSVVLPAAVCVFSHSLEILPPRGGGGSGVGLRVNDWVVFQSSYRSAVLLQQLRDLVAQFVARRMATRARAAL